MTVRIEVVFAETSFEYDLSSRLNGRRAGVAQVVDLGNSVKSRGEL